ncbi:BZ3500_MvSof-1268-A1-R1_Chr7-1g09062 [Microbotryum saponariae]|uniref:BZ3500_MvSof-1268-A1-R1_Chr7-1g09062 protein n=1 Tax=Microbotryum saponariae TaxID=289078 RepID=A0A2X0LPV6_9BASI|nr:BZ3501_MvSof-1269-A2-R1_Chr7-1g08766 [Microbotryum saponariae]SDA02715.1 BZ3500_MvSof-1268-A1-R1_Chr7-1g09062 [Microbotryum saponariae]
MSKDLSRTLQRTLTHLRPASRKGGQFGAPVPSHFGPQPAFVHVKDRIPYWNIAPMDKVVLVKGPKSIKRVQGTVHRVEREANRVWLRENEFAVSFDCISFMKTHLMINLCIAQIKKRQQAQYPGEALTASYSGGDAQATYYQPRAYHVSNLRLQVTDGGKTYTATRLRRSKVTWDRRNGRFHWHRYGLVPELVGTEIEGAQGGTHTGWVKIPWPKIEVEKTAKGENDVGAEESLKSTWVPTVDTLTQGIDELKLSDKEFGLGKQSRAHKTKRYNERKALGKGTEQELQVSSLGQAITLDK